jgi:small GTP-binding protein
MQNGNIKTMKKKVCLIGDSRVGKTSLIRRYVYDEFDDKYIATLGAKISKKDLTLTVPLPGTDQQTQVNLTMSIWDLIGHRDREYWGLIKRYYMNTDGGLFVCDLTVRQTYDNLNDWVASLFNTIGRVPILFLANKHDLENQATFNEEDMERIATQYRTESFLTSAKTGENVENAFYDLGMILVKDSLRLDSITSPKQVADEMIVSFCDLHGGVERGMPMISHQFKQANVDLNSPTKQDLTVVLNRLVDLTTRVKGREVANLERQKFMRLINRLP